MIVEFLGTPGAGKTTLIPAVIKSFQEQSVDAFTVVGASRLFAGRTLIGAAVNRLAPISLRQPLLWQVFYHFSTLYRSKFIVKNMGLIRQVLSSQKPRPISSEDREHVLYWFFHLVGYYEFLISHSLNTEGLIFDEGFIHRVVQFNASDVEEPDPAKIFAYIDKLPHPDMVIVPHAPWEICEERIYKRGLWERFRDKTPEEVTRYVVNSHQIVNIARDYIKTQGWPVVEVDNSSDNPAVSEAELHRKLSKILSPAPGITTNQVNITLG